MNLDDSAVMVLGIVTLLVWVRGLYREKHLRRALEEIAHSGVLPCRDVARHALGLSTLYRATATDRRRELADRARLN